MIMKLRMVKTITVHQPWATLLAWEFKRLESRGWSTDYRGPLAIHAGKHVDREACEREPIRSVLADLGYTADTLPTGAVLAIGELKEVYPINIAGDSFAGSIDSEGKVARHIEGNEFEFGWYDEGRFAWEISQVMRLAEPIPAKGQQRLWYWRLPA
ncbi:hypothetical protein [Paenibacillus sanguinis]|uniref:hypothetical protein n=1 Tax=Paenibacillus sanguinis TaxID=225906 RepID=UPI000367DFBD|nr:hypothetical protein [Paenibacillus sanguinis]